MGRTVVAMRSLSHLTWLYLDFQSQEQDSAHRVFLSSTWWHSQVILSTTSAFTTWRWTLVKTSAMQLTALTNHTVELLHLSPTTSLSPCFLASSHPTRTQTLSTTSKCKSETLKRLPLLTASLRHLPVVIQRLSCWLEFPVLSHTTKPTKTFQFRPTTRLMLASTLSLWLARSQCLTTPKRRPTPTTQDKPNLTLSSSHAGPIQMIRLSSWMTWLISSVNLQWQARRTCLNPTQTVYSTRSLQSLISQLSQLTKEPLVTFLSLSLPILAWSVHTQLPW